jgi:hypothetical protein
MDLLHPSDFIGRFASKGVHTDTLGGQRTLNEDYFSLTPRNTAGFKVERIDLQYI